MLVLTRGECETVSLFKNGEPFAEVTITRIGRGRVRLGFVAGKDIAIYRKELVVAAQREHEALYSDVGGDAGAA